MDQKVIDIARQHLNLPDSVTDEEIVHDLDGSVLVARIEAGIAMRELKAAVLGATEPFGRNILDGIKRIGCLTGGNDVSDV